MRVPYSWLREVVAAGAPGWDVDPGDLEQTLVSIGHEVEEVITLGPVGGPLTVGRVTGIEELTEFKKPIRACLVEISDYLGVDSLAEHLHQTGDFLGRSRPVLGRKGEDGQVVDAEVDRGLDDAADGSCPGPVAGEMLPAGPG